MRPSKQTTRAAEKHKQEVISLTQTLGLQAWISDNHFFPLSPFQTVLRPPPTHPRPPPPPRRTTRQRPRAAWAQTPLRPRLPDGDNLFKNVCLWPLGLEGLWLRYTMLQNLPSGNLVFVQALQR